MRNATFSKVVRWHYPCNNNKRGNVNSGVINPIQDGGGAKSPPPTSFSPVTSTNVGFGSQNFLTFSFNPFATLVQNFKLVPSASPNLLNLDQDHPSKKWFFWSNPYNIEVVITSLIEMLQLPNFGHMNTSTI